MDARMVSNQLLPGKMDEWLAVIRDSVVPSLKEQDGFRGFVALIDREHGTSIGDSVRDGAAGLAAGKTSGNYRQQIARLGGVLAGPSVREVCEVTAVAWQ